MPDPASTRFGIISPTAADAADGPAISSHIRDRLEAVGATIAVDPWHVVGASGQPTYASGASTVGPTLAPQTTARFYRDRDWVRLKGRVTSAPIGGSVFTLPSTYRPPDTQTYECPRLDAAGSVRVTITAAGLVSSSVGSVSFALDMIGFRAV